MILLSDFQSLVSLQLFRQFFAQGKKLRLVVPADKEVPKEIQEKVDIVRGSFEHSNTWGPQFFVGVETLVYHAFSGPKSVDREATMLSFAKVFGVKNVVRVEDLNSANFDGQNILPSAVEAAAMQVGLAVAFIYTNIFMQSLLSYIPNIREHQRIDVCSNGKGVSFVDVGDVADAIVKIIEDSAYGKKYIFTGAEVITYASATDLIAKALKQKIQCQEIPKDVLLGAFKQMNFDEAQTLEVIKSVDHVLSGAAAFKSNDLKNLIPKQANLKEYIERVFPELV